jgi:hypothetical protein
LSTTIIIPLCEAEKLLGMLGTPSVESVKKALAETPGRVFM